MKRNRNINFKNCKISSRR